MVEKNKNGSVISNEETEKYLEGLYEKKFSAYDFMCLFCAVCASQKQYKFNRDNLLDFIIKCKNEGKYMNLLNDIKFKNDGMFNYSNNYDEAIMKLKWCGMLWTKSPEKDTSVQISEDTDYIELIYNRIKYIGEFSGFFGQYKNYELNLNQKNTFLQENNNSLYRDNPQIKKILNKRRK